MDEAGSIPWEVVLTRYRLRWGDLVGRAWLGLLGSDVACVCFFLVGQVLWGCRLSLGPSSCVNLRWLLENFLLFLHAWSALGNLEHYFVAALYLAVLFPVSGCCSWSTGIGFFGRRCCLSLGRNAWLDLEYLFCISTGLSERIAHKFYVAVDSNPEVWVSVLAQNVEVCFVDASGA